MNEYFFSIATLIANHIFPSETRRPTIERARYAQWVITGMANEENP